MTCTVSVTPVGLLLTRMTLVVLTVVLEFSVFTVTLRLVWDRMGVLPTLLFMKVRPLPGFPVVRSALTRLIPLLGSRLVRHLLRFSRPVIVSVIGLVLLASTMAPWMFVDPRSWTVRVSRGPIMLVTSRQLVHRFLTVIRMRAFGLAILGVARFSPVTRWEPLVVMAPLLIPVAMLRLLSLRILAMWSVLTLSLQVVPTSRETGRPD